jgi:hypothetical protein
MALLTDFNSLTFRRVVCMFEVNVLSKNSGLDPGGKATWLFLQRPGTQDTERTVSALLKSKSLYN